MYIRKAVAGLALIAALSGCTSSKPADPPVPAPQPQGHIAPAPAPVQPMAEVPSAPAVSECTAPDTAVPRATADGSLPNGDPLVVDSGWCVGQTYASAFWASFRLPGGVDDERVRQALKVEGAAVDRLIIRPGTNDSYVFVMVAPGRPGDVVRIHLNGDLGAGAPVDMGFYVTRRENPYVEVQYKNASGEWVTITPGDSIPASKENALRVRPVGGANMAQLIQRIQEVLGVQVIGEKDGWTDITLPQQFGRFSFHVGAVDSASGLKIQDGFFTAYQGAAPSLALVDPATGKEQSLAMAPADVQAVSMHPSGKWAALMALDPKGYVDYRPYLVDVPGGKVSAIDFPMDRSWGSLTYWAEDKLYLAANGRLGIVQLSTGKIDVRPSAAVNWGTLSPDGRYGMGYTLHYGRENANEVVPVTVVLLDLQTGEERVFGDAVHRVMPFHDPAGIRYQWQADGALLLHDVTDADGPSRMIKAERTLRLDPKSGELTPVNVAVENADQYQPQWVKSPNGQMFQTQVFPTWEAIAVTTDGGAKYDAGRGYPVGWAQDGRLLVVRWENGQFQRGIPGH